MIRVMIVDDEDHGRRSIANRLCRYPDFEIAGICENGDEAIDAIRQRVPDVVFLDVQMPGKTGFDVVNEIGPDTCPMVIFVTAYDRYALLAFDVHAFDYLLKPIDDERFDAAVVRVREAFGQRKNSQLRQRLSALMNDLCQPGPSDADAAHAKRLIVRSGSRTVFVTIEEIDWVAATGDYVSLHVGKKTWLMRETMAVMERRLRPHGFARIHRSTLVNAERIAELRYLDNGDYRVVLRDGTELKLSRSFHGALQALLNATLR